MDGVSKATINTLGGKTAENRGRRGDNPPNFNIDSPFEDGQLSDNWAKRKGWDKYYEATHEGNMYYEKNYQGKGPKNYMRKDEAIYEEVCEMLFVTPYVDATEIEVEAKDGIVTLRGQVKDRDMKRMAESVIESISGVFDVQNLLTFKRSSYEQER